MTKCPSCKANITYLYNVQNIWIRTPLNSKGEYEQDERKEWGAGESGEPDSYDCPICGAQLFFKEEDALKFFGIKI